MKKLIFALSLLFVFVSTSVSQSPPSVQRHRFTATGTTRTEAIGPSGLSYFQLSWRSDGNLPSLCTITMETSVNGTTWTAGVIAGDCTTNGESAITNVSAAYYRLNLTAYTVSGSNNFLNVAVLGYFTTPATAGGSVEIEGDALTALEDILAAISDASARLIGGLSSVSPTSYINCDQTAIYNTNTNGRTTLVSLTTDEIVYVCGMSIMNFTTSEVTASLGSGTGADCVTTYTAITPTYPLDLDTLPGFVIPTGLSAWVKTAASEHLCLETNAAVVLKITINYTKF